MTRFIDVPALSQLVQTLGPAAFLAELFPKHRIIGIENSREILLGGGNVACITMPQYAAPKRA